MSATTPVADIAVRSVVFDCDDPAALARFYHALLGGALHTEDPAWCEVRLDSVPVKLAFQLVPHYQRPQWPDGVPQQLHLDLTVGDLEAASARAVALGAQRVGEPVDEGASVFLVHFDPAGHPFCFCVDR